MVSQDLPHRTLATHASLLAQVLLRAVMPALTSRVGSWEHFTLACPYLRTTVGVPTHLWATSALAAAVVRNWALSSTLRAMMTAAHSKLLLNWIQFSILTAIAASVKLTIGKLGPVKITTACGAEVFGFAQIVLLLLLLFLL